MTIGWVNHAHRLLYIDIPKNASSSTQKYLMDLGDWAWTQDAREWNDYHTFSIIREPVDRYISGVLEFGARPPNRFRMTRWRKQYPDVETLEGFLSAAAAELLENREPTLFDRHTVPQYDYVQDLEISQWLLFGYNVGADFEILLSKHGIKITQPLYNIKQRDLNDKLLFAKILEEEHRDLLYKFYSKDQSIWKANSGILPGGETPNGT